MYSIQMSEGADWSGADGDAFVREIMAVSERHKAAGSALFFAVILYSYSDPEFRAALQDRRYWRALHEASGRYLTVFAINTPLMNPSSPFKDCGHGDPTQAQQALDTLKKNFSGNAGLTVPCIQFFQIESGTVIDGLSVTLSGETVEAAYQNVRGYIDAATGALSQLKLENKENSAEIFVLVKKAVERRTSTNAVQAALKKAGPVTVLVKLLAAVSGNH